MKVVCLQAVIPLSEDSGMLEWVPQTVGLRNILLKLYKERGVHMTGKELKSLQLPVNAPIEYVLVVTLLLLFKTCMQCITECVRVQAENGHL